MAIQITDLTPLTEITDRVIEELLENDYDESLYFDFKAGIEGTTDSEKHAMRKALTSFANTRGGFLFLGILDKNNREGRTGLDRLEGLQETAELGKRIVQKYLGPAVCFPALPIDQTAVVDVRSKSIGVVHVRQSEARPHAIKFGPDRSLEFWVRGTGTAQPMDYAQLLSEMDRSREARSWLIALALELESVIKKAKSSNSRATGDPPDELPERFNSIIQTNAGDLLRVLGYDSVVVEKLIPLRDLLDDADAEREYMQARAREQPPYTPSVTPTRAQWEWTDRMRQLKMKTSGPTLQIAIQAEILRNHLVQTYPDVRQRLEGNTTS
jgi:hypothetical protein